MESGWGHHNVNPLIASIIISGRRRDSGPDTTAPTVSSRTIPAAGTTIVIVHSEVVSIGAGGNGGLTLSASGGAVTATYSSGAGTATLTWTLSRTVNSGETVTASYTQPGDGIEDASGNDLASFSGQSVTNNSTAGGGSYLVEEDCEGTGTPSGWTDTGSPNWDYTTTVLQGSQSVLFNGTSSYVTFTGQTTCYGYFLWRTTSIPGSTNTIGGFRDSSGNPLALARINSSGNLAMYANSSDSSFTTDAVSANTTYHIWYSFTSGGTCTVAFSTDGVRPTSGNKFTSKTGGSGTAARFAIGGGTLVSVADRMLVSTAQIGDNP